MGQALLDLLDAIGSDESADRPSPMHVGEFVVRTVPLRVLRMHAAASRVSADVVLA